MAVPIKGCFAKSVPSNTGMKISPMKTKKKEMKTEPEVNHLVREQLQPRDSVCEWYGNTVGRKSNCFSFSPSTYLFPEPLDDFSLFSDNASNFLWRKRQIKRKHQFKDKSALMYVCFTSDC